MFQRVGRKVALSNSENFSNECRTSEDVRRMDAVPETEAALCENYRALPSLQFMRNLVHTVFTCIKPS